MNFLLVALIFIGSSQALQTCNTTNPGMLRCEYLYDEDDLSVTAIAIKYHSNPQKLADFNLVSIKDSFADQNYIRVPYDSCNAVTNVYTCYDWQQGDTFDSITNSVSFIRNATLVEEINQDLKYGDTDFFYSGMQLKIPFYACVPRYEYQCFKIVDPNFQTIITIANMFNTDQTTLMKLNEDILGTNTELIKGMELKVPRHSDYYKTPNPCQENDYWKCHTIVVNETVWDISGIYSINPYLLAEVNGIKWASRIVIEIGQILAIPLRSGQDCVPRENVNFCAMSAPADTFVYPAYLSQFMSQYYYFWDWNHNYELIQRIKDMNSDTQPSKAYQETTEIQTFPGIMNKVPLYNCQSNEHAHCIKRTSTEANNLLNKDFYNPQSLYNSDSNHYCFLPDGSCDSNDMIKAPQDSHELSYQNCGGIPEGCSENDWCHKCEAVPGQHVCYKTGLGDSFYSVAQYFELDWQALCQYNGNTNCSCLAADDNFLKIPVNGFEQMIY